MHFFVFIRPTALRKLCIARLITAQQGLIPFSFAESSKKGNSCLIYIKMWKHFGDNSKKMCIFATEGRETSTETLAAPLRLWTRAITLIIYILTF